VLKYLVSVLDKVSQLPLYSIRAFFHPVQTLFHPDSQAFFIQAGPIYAEWGPFPPSPNAQSGYDEFIL